MICPPAAQRGSRRGRSINLQGGQLHPIALVSGVLQAVLVVLVTKVLRPEVFEQQLALLFGGDHLSVLLQNLKEV